MNRQEFEDTARRYREELFRMYANQNVTPQPRPQNPRPAPPPPPPVQPAQKAVPALAAAEPPQDDLRRPEDFAPSSIPDTPAPPEPEAPPADAPEIPKRPYTGTIMVHVMTAQGARPVTGASVMITHTTNREPELISLQRTDDCGTIKPVTVPAPPPSADQRSPAYFTYNLSVQAPGYYREHSEDVPVFPNITSVQNFDLIPLPAGTGEPLPGGDITYYNQMRQY